MSAFLSDDDIVTNHENEAPNQNSENNGEDNTHHSNDDNDKDDKKDDDDIIKPKKPRNKLVVLNTERLKGPKGIHTIEQYFAGFEYKGKGKEKEDLSRVMKRLEHWAHRLFPKYDFDDSLQRIEQLGVKRDLKVFVHKYRMDMMDNDFVRNVEDDEDNALAEKETDEPTNQVDDPFDDLVAGHQFDEPMFLDHQPPVVQAPPRPAPVLDSETLARMEKNRQLALEKRRASAIRNESTTVDQQPPVVQEPPRPAPEMDPEILARIEKNRQLALEKKRASAARAALARMQVASQEQNSQTQTMDTDVNRESTSDDVDNSEAMEALWKDLSLNIA